MSAIGVFSFGRTQSQRCPNKLLRPFAGTTLTAIVLDKLARCGSPAFFAGYEEAFRLACAQRGVTFVQRDARSATIDGPIADILSFLRDVPYRYLILVSACAPLLELDTIRRFAADCLAHAGEPAISVRICRKHLLSEDRKALNFSLESPTLNTKAVRPVYELTDALYGFDREFFLSRGTYWDWRTVRFVEIPNAQTIDVDTEEEFMVAEALWHARPVSSALAAPSQQEGA